jgi:hypothetical protein
MKFFRVLTLSLFFLLATYHFYTSWISSNSHTIESLVPATLLQQVVEYANEHLPTKGQLIVAPDGFGYIKVDDNYIHTLFPMLGLEKYGFKEPPYFRKRGSPGAHISVFYADEHIKPKEVGKIFNFELKKIVFVNTSKDTTYAVLIVEAPELEKLREKYGLEPKLHGHEFHISLAKKVIHPQ